MENYGHESLGTQIDGMNFQTHFRACLKKAFCKMCVTICGRFCPDEGAVAGYGNRIRAKYTAKWGVQIAGMIFQTRSTPDQSLLLPWTFKISLIAHGGTSMSW